MLGGAALERQCGLQATLTEEFAAQQLVRADERAGRLRDAQVKREQAG